MKLGWLTLLALTACGDDPHNALETQVGRTRIGDQPDQWIEMRNVMGQWERVGLIFGYAAEDGDHTQCTKAIAGLKAGNPERDFRCSPAN